MLLRTNNRREDDLMQNMEAVLFSGKAGFRMVELPKPVIDPTVVACAQIRARVGTAGEPVVLAAFHPALHLVTVVIRTPC